MSRLAELARLGAVRRAVPIGQLTTYKLGGAAAWFAEVETIEELATVGEAARVDRAEVAVIGRGSNLLVADAGFPGLVVRLGGSFTAIDIEGELVVAGGAAGLPQLARTAAKAGRGGLEWCVGVPGSVGGAVAMNAGCFGSDTAGVLVSADLIDLATGERRRPDPAGLGLGYRTSNVAASEVCVAATFRTVPVERDEAERTMRNITRWRKEHQPGGTYNAGSVFKNPPGDAAGRIIDQLGLKGLRRGDVAVSDRHANFFTAGPDATAQDVKDLVDAVRAAVEAATGVHLVPEIRMIGQFVESGRR